LLKHIPEQTLKHLSNFLNLSYGKRPKGATDCNSLNSGGHALSSGLVSGHEFNLTSFIFYLIYDANSHFTTKRITLISLLLIIDLLLASARVSLRCHTKLQVTLGFGLGIIWGYVIYLILTYLQSKSKRITKDRLVLTQLFD
jgi:membrane-associated phospholipid phosphatase